MRSETSLCDPDPTDAEILTDSLVLDVRTWPAEPDIRYGEKEVRRLCHRFNLNAQSAIAGMRDFIDDNRSVPDELKAVVNCVKTLPCSTAECERGFSLMNIISTDLRATLLVNNVSSLMFLNLNGPPLSDCNPHAYVKS